MIRLTVICHAATEAVRAARFPRDEDLDRAGAAAAARAPAITAARWLAGPERRATATAAALAGRRVVAVDPELRDWDCGRWAGHELAALSQSEPAALGAWLSDAGAAPHGGESLADLLGRTGRWLDAQAGTGRRTVAVTHPAVLRAAVVQALGAGPAAFWRIDAPPLCRARLSHDGRRWLLQSLGPIEGG